MVYVIVPARGGMRALGGCCSGDAYENSAAFTAGYQRAMWICAALLVAGALIAYATVRDDVLEADPTAARVQTPAAGDQSGSVPAPRPATQCKTHCAVGAPPWSPPVADRPARPAEPPASLP